MTELQSGAPVPSTSASYGSNRRRRQPKPAWWLWGNILSLEAPAVAVLWHLLLARVFAVKEGFAVPVALGSAVWVIYLIDHLLDTRGRRTAYPEPARKIFFRDHWHFMLGIAVGALTLSLLFARMFLTRTLFEAGLGGGLIVFLYFGLVHLLPARVRMIWPREAMVALLFSWGICLPFGLDAGLQFRKTLFSALLVFLLCWLNCCAVEVWDWYAAGNRFQDRPNAVAKWITEHLIFIALLLLTVGVGAGLLEHLHKAFLVALVLSASSLAGVARLKTLNGAARHGISLYCVLMDLALCWPLPILAALRLPAVTAFWH